MIHNNEKNISKNELFKRLDEINLRMFGVFIYKGKKYFAKPETINESKKIFENDYNGLDFDQLNIERLRLAKLIIT